MNPNEPNDDELPRAPEEDQDTVQDLLGGFPRHLTTRLIDQGKSDRGHREVLAGWVIGLGLAVLALAFPLERLLFEERELPVRLLTSWVGQVVSLNDVGLFALRTALAALAYGACLPVMLSIGRRAGFPMGLNLVVSLGLLLSPAAWMAGTTVEAASVGLLFSLLAFASLWRTPNPGILPALLWLGLATACSPVYLWLLPPVAMAASKTDGESRGRLWRGVASVVGGVALAFALRGLLPLLGGGDSHLTAIEEMKRGLGTLVREFSESHSGPGVVLTWGVGLLPGLGLALAGVLSLFVLKRNESEEAPPRWLLWWCVLPLAITALLSAPETRVPYLWLLGPALVGCLDLLGRRDADSLPLICGVALVLQIGVLTGVLAVSAATDPLSAWRAMARERLNPDDLVFTDDPQHLRILKERWGVEARLAKPDGPRGGGDSNVLPWVDREVVRAMGVLGLDRRIAIDITNDETTSTAARELRAALSRRLPDPLFLEE